MSSAVNYNVSQQSLDKVHRFFVSEVINTGDRSIQLTVPDLAEKSGVSVATAHKATRVLESEGLLEIKTFASRKNPNLYYYKGDLADFEKERRKKSQIEYLKDLVSSMSEENKALKSKVFNLEIEIRKLRKMLGIYV